MKQSPPSASCCYDYHHISTNRVLSIERNTTGRERYYKIEIKFTKHAKDTRRENVKIKGHLLKGSDRVRHYFIQNYFPSNKTNFNNNRN